MDRTEAHIRLRDTAIAREFGAAYDASTKAAWSDDTARVQASLRFTAAHSAYVTALAVLMVGR